MSSYNTFIHDFLLSPEHKQTIKLVTGWDVDDSWEVSSRRWRRLYQHRDNVLVTVFHYGKRGVVFLGEDLTYFSDKYRATDFGSPSQFSSRTKYELFEDHKGHDSHCQRCANVHR